ncbi:C39 family peptidase [Bailinhaonella thermotolerans]|uniref:Peptidase C39 family protein n=1 Tax=Bailinhaonella thermotolerans TaxID=1070861 RepID=A0A3A4B881_9ACTN|nr:C39 family peptidase [Bailinhaonella thermotolerans]RJL30328.1 peptidase C39 family protein [Bailinhaonella thermotolerans]
MSAQPTTASIVLHRFSGLPAYGEAEGLAEYLDPFGGGSRTWEVARWTGEECEIGFPATELVPSWIADTPGGTWIEVGLRARTVDDTLTKWYVLGRWTSGDAVHRTTLPGQGDADGDVAVDTFVAVRPVVSYRLRVTAHRLVGARAWPRLRSLRVMASAVHHPAPVPVSPPGPAAGLELAVPCRSQKVHAGHFPQWDGGGDNWCSPASVTMVLEYWGRRPDPAELTWIDPGDPHPAVDHAARHMYDHGYQGTGNWPFSTAYAGGFGLDAFVTRLRSLTEVESFIAAGIPVITSQAFREHELPGSGYSTSGHIMVVTGFTAAGDVIANDPAAPDDATVRRVYPRAAFENVWLRSSGSGGIVYIVRPPEIPLPPLDSVSEQEDSR